jgi:hypothetical protein
MDDLVTDKTTKLLNPNTSGAEPNFGWMDILSRLLDNQFKIPFTNIRFGFDFLIGLIPTVGDFFSFAISSALLVAMMQRGVSFSMLLKMLTNLLLDTLVGSIPILGDIFDLRYKANRRNLAMLKEYYRENPNPPAAKRSFGLLLLIFLLLLLAIFVALWWVVGLLVTKLFGY